MNERRVPYASVEICAGAGGLALGVAEAGFRHEILVEIDPHACKTLRENRPKWNVLCGDLREFVEEVVSGSRVLPEITLLSGGVPCPPYSVAGPQRGPSDERDLFPAMLRLVEALKPRAIMIENVPGLLQAKFAAVRDEVVGNLQRLGYEVTADDWRILDAQDFGVSQARRRAVLVALKSDINEHFIWPSKSAVTPPTVGELLAESMGARGWADAEKWAQRAAGLAPTLVGGSRKHGGADLGPTRSKRVWAQLGVDAHGLADEVPGPDWVSLSRRDDVDGPRLTVEQAALLQGFPADWVFAGGKTARYRQVGNAFPMPVAKAVAAKIMAALRAADKKPSAPRQVSATGSSSLGDLVQPVTIE